MYFQYFRAIRPVGLFQESLTRVLDSAHDCLESSNEARAHDGLAAASSATRRPAHATNTRSSTTIAALTTTEAPSTT